MTAKWNGYRILCAIGCLLIGIPMVAWSQQVGTAITEDGSLPNTNAMLDIQSPASGDGKGLLIPRITEDQRTNASSALAGGLLNDSGELRGGPAHGLMVYQTDGEQGLYYNTSATETPAWTKAGGGVGGDFMADGSVPMTGNLNMNGRNISGVASNIAFTSDSIMIGKNANAVSVGLEGEVAIGSTANAAFIGVAVGYQANGYFAGTAIGTKAIGTTYGAAVGYDARGTNYGAAVGTAANGVNVGAAVGNSAIGRSFGAALGASANASLGGVSVGYFANSLESGVAIGYDANGVGSNIAIGCYANAYDSTHVNGGDRIAIGRGVTNLVEDSCAIRGTLYLDGGTGVLYRSTFGSGAWTAVGGGGSAAIGAFGCIYELATALDAVIIGGADVPFSNNGPLSGVSHTAGTTTMTVSSAGTYKIDYSIAFTVGLGSQIAVAVNGTVDPSTPMSLLVSAGNVSGSAILSLQAGDTLTLRNNSMVAITLDLAPAVGAQCTVVKMD